MTNDDYLQDYLSNLADMHAIFTVRLLCSLRTAGLLPCQPAFTLTVRTLTATEMAHE